MKAVPIFKNSKDSLTVTSLSGGAFFVLRQDTIVFGGWKYKINAKLSVGSRRAPARVAIAIRFRLQSDAARPGQWMEMIRSNPITDSVHADAEPT